MSNTYRREYPKVPILKTENLSERVVAWLRQAILNGEFHPGDELPSEAEMCAMLGIGKSSIREALKMLQMIGVVEIQQGKRSRICNTIKSDMMMPLIFNLMLQGNSSREFYDFRVIFEQVVIEFALEQATAEDVASLEEEVAYFRTKLEDGTIQLEDDFRFHKKLLEICRNSFIMQIGTLLLEIFEVPMRRLKVYDAKRLLEDHEQVLQLFQQGDGAREKVRDIVKKSFRVYYEALDMDE